MRHLLLALFGTLPLLVFSVHAQEILAANRDVRVLSSTTFHAWLTKKVDAGKIRVGDQVHFKSERAILFGKTVISSAVFHGRVAYVQRVEDNEQRESRLSIVVERIEWKQSSMPLNAYIVAFISYRHFAGPPVVPQSAWPESGRPPGAPDFADSSGMLRQKNERTPMLYESLARGQPPRNVQRFDFSTSVKGIKIVRTSVEKNPGTILVRHNQDIVLPRLLPVMLEQIEPEEK